MHQIELSANLAITIQTTGKGNRNYRDDGNHN